MIADVIGTTNTATGLAIARPVGRLRTMLRIARRLMRRSSCTTRCTALVTVVAVVIAIIARVAVAGLHRTRCRCDRHRAGSTIGASVTSPGATVPVRDGTPRRSAPRRLHPAGFSGVHSPLENSADSWPLTRRGGLWNHTGRSPLQAPPMPTLEYPGVRSSTPGDDNGGQQERGTSVFSGAMRGFSYPCRPQGISRGLLSITGTRSPIARLPRAWRCNTLETVRRGKAPLPSGCESRPATVAPAGSNRSG